MPSALSIIPNKNFSSSLKWTPIPPPAPGKRSAPLPLADFTKSGIMIGLGETEAEVLSVMRDIKEAGCDFLTIGQYLQPRRTNIPVVEYIKPEIFEKYRVEGLDMGFEAVASSPLTRSSMDAGKMFGNQSSEDSD